MDDVLLQYEVFEYALVLPLTGLKTGVFVDKNPVPQSLECLFGGKIEFNDYSEPSRHIKSKAIYAGILYNHYGHFLIESLSRLWVTRNFPEIPILWVGERHINAWQKEILDLLEIHNSHIFIQEPTEVEHLILPELGSVIGQSLKKEFADFLSWFQASEVEPGKYCWVSRSKLNQGPESLMQALYFEDKLKGLGWEIYHPQEHSVLEQLKYLSSCEKIAGVQGSAFHFSLLVKDLKSHLYILEARGFTSIDYEIIAGTKKLSQTLLRLAEGHKKFPTHNPDFFNYLCPNFTRILDALDVPVATFESHGISVISKVINTIHEIQPIQAYLEIGVKEGFHFFDIQAVHKVGVTPYAKLDFRGYLSPGVEIFETTPEEYFTHFYDNKKFDVICLDYSKHLESMFKDFTMSLSCSHENTIWLINCTLPTDVFCTLPDNTDAFNLRKQMTGVEDWSWHGQVYQFILALHDFFPMMNYFTMSEWNNHQTIVWFEPRPHFTPRFNSFETIAKASYTDYLTHQDLYNILPLEEAYAKLTELAQREIHYNDVQKIETALP